LIESDLKKVSECFGMLGFDENKIMMMYGSLLVSVILESFELFKKYLMMTIDPRLKLNFQNPLGKILYELKKNGIEHRYDECMDIDIRNAISHGWYWWSDNKFVYNLDKTLQRTKEIHLGELFMKHREVELLLISFLDNAFQRILEIKKSDDH